VEPIRITTVSQKVVDKKPVWPSGYEITIERIGLDQHGAEWHSFHTRQVPADSPIQIGDVFTEEIPQ